MKRRNALQLIAIAAAAPLPAQHAGHGAGAAPADEGGPRFFSAAQNALIDCIAEMILPADEHSGGASEAGVSLFIDGLVADSDADVRQAWTDGLAAMDAEAKSRFGSAFVDCSEVQRDQILSALAAHEAAAQSELERFFVRIKRQTISGYYSSRLGLLDELEYKGGGPIAEYPSCAHPEHIQ